ncbi:Alpha/Beta hydrolase protein [Lasiosphaeria hispida]|uniref:Alpha/Beta hydrolase protein n=1 Tax=Lasiosphaeria hispida TaxID=260671 RepID=A0AAJ0HJ26_9PEZI|nr:Alpha/Beta hydrolase protein [Lasiosphaeria hispida]
MERQHQRSDDPVATLPSTSGLQWSPCYPVTFHVRASASNVIFKHPPDPYNPEDITAFAAACSANATGPLLNGTTLITGTFRVKGTYCRPASSSRHHHYPPTLQLLVHGGSYNRDIWSGHPFGDDYNWHASAIARGYHTLAIDRLAHGGDTYRRYPDPITVVQGPLQMEIIHQLIRAVRLGGRRSPLPRAFRRVVYVGHSYGAMLGTALVGKYPEDVDGLVVMGFGVFVNMARTWEMMRFMPAALVDTRFKRLPLGYLAGSSRRGREEVFYTGFYDDRIPGWDYRHQDTVTVGEICSVGFVEPAEGFRGKPVLAVTGASDVIFCSGELPGTCEEKMEATGLLMFPNAKPEVFIPRNTGHGLTLHLTAAQTFYGVQNFLDGHFA